MCILTAYALLKVVRHYDLSILYMSVMGFFLSGLRSVWAGGALSICLGFV